MDCVINSIELTRFLGISDGAVRDLARVGHVVRAGNGRYNLWASIPRSVRRHEGQADPVLGADQKPGCVVRYIERHAAPLCSLHRLLPQGRDYPLDQLDSGQVGWQSVPVGGGSWRPAGETTQRIAAG